MIYLILVTIIMNNNNEVNNNNNFLNFDSIENNNLNENINNKTTNPLYIFILYIINFI